MSFLLPAVVKIKRPSPTKKSDKPKLEKRAKLIFKGLAAVGNMPKMLEITTDSCMQIMVRIGFMSVELLPKHVFRLKSFFVEGRSILTTVAVCEFLR